jgi:Protein of unknown function (DUF4231)
MSDNTSFLDLLDKWRQRTRTYQKAHYDAAEQLHRRNYQLGVPVVVLSAIVATSVFATISQDPGIWSHIAVGIVSIAVAVLSALQTFFRFAERAEQHRAAAIRYGIINRELERLRTFAPSNQEGAQSVVMQIEQKLNDLAEHTPAIPLVLLARTRDALVFPTTDSK